MYRMLKLKIFFRRFDWAIDHKFVNCDNENFDMLLKKEPCADNLSFNLFSWVERKSLITSIFCCGINVILNIFVSTRGFPKFIYFNIQIIFYCISENCLTLEEFNRRWKNIETNLLIYFES